MAELEEFALRAQTVARQSEIDRAVVAAVQALDAVGIETLVLKGPALARTLYSSGEHRGYFDLDLLISPRTRDAVGQVLARLGYADVAELRGFHVFPEPHGDLWTRRSEVGIVVVDLHWRLPGCEKDPGRVWEVLRARRQWIELEAGPAPILDSAGLALHLALHAAQHGPEDTKAIADLRRGLDRWPSGTWREAAVLASEVGAAEAFSAGLRLLPPGAELARELGLPAARGLLRAIAERELRPRGTFHLQAFIEADGVRGRALVLRSSLFPEPAWIVRERLWARRSRLHLAAAYALHLARAPGWAIRAWQFRRPAERRAEIKKSARR